MERSKHFAQIRFKIEHSLEELWRQEAINIKLSATIQKQENASSSYILRIRDAQNKYNLPSYTR